MYSALGGTGSCVVATSENHVPLAIRWHRIVPLLLKRGSPVTLNEVADLIVSPEAEHLSRGNCLNRRGIRGYYLQLKCGSNWCKISVSHADRHSDRITVVELDEIDPTTLQPSLRSEERR